MSTLNRQHLMWHRVQLLMSTKLQKIPLEKAEAPHKLILSLLPWIAFLSGMALLVLAGGFIIARYTVLYRERYETAGKTRTVQNGVENSFRCSSFRRCYKNFT